MIETSFSSLLIAGSKSNSRRKPKKGWNDRIAHIRKQAIYWHSALITNGRPSNGWLKDTMIKWRKLYHKEIKNCRMDKKMEKAEELLAAALQGDKKFMDGLRRNKCNTTETEVDFVDGVSGEQNIANKFKDLYSGIYTSVGDSEKTRQKLEQLEAKIRANPHHQLDVTRMVTKDKIKQAATLMKPRKADYSDAFQSKSHPKCPR